LSGLSTSAARTKLQPVLTGSIRLEASSACQLRCPSCPTTTGHTERIVGKSVLRLADFVKLIDGNPWIGNVELSNYGEVFLNRDLLAIFRHAYERNVTLEIGNGANLNHVRDEVLEGLVRYRVAKMTCSIDGASQQTYARYRVRGNYERVIRHIRRINHFKRVLGSELPNLTWQFIAFGHNEHEISEARDLAAELDMDFLVKLNWDPEFSPVMDKDAISTATGTGAATRAEFREKHGSEYFGHICEQLWNNPQINWDGKVLGCCRNFWGDFGGNAFRDGLIESLQHEKLTYARRMLQGREPARSDIPCTTCELYLHRQAANRWINPRPRLRIDEQTINGLWMRASAAAKNSDLEKAVRFARVLLQLKPDHAGALDLLRQAAETAGRFEAAAYYRAKADSIRALVDAAVGEA
jgi:MoaA/NifB/PqqE/SkfB family radical SAM enzyme